MIGEVEDDAVLSYGDVITMGEALTAWKGTLEKVFKTVSGAEKRRTGTGGIKHSRWRHDRRVPFIMQEASMSASTK